MYEYVEGDVVVLRIVDVILYIKFGWFYFDFGFWRKSSILLYFEVICGWLGIWLILICYIWDWLLLGVGWCVGVVMFGSGYGLEIIDRY